MRPAEGAADLRAETVLTGRESELLFLRRCLTDATRGQGSVVLVSGEAGLGKTRLIEEAAAIAAAHGATVLCGRASAGKDQLPYGLFPEILSGCQDDDGQDTLRTVIAELAPHLWSAVFGTEKAPAKDTTPGAAPDVRQALFVSRLAELLTSRAKGGPLLLCLEDLHHADSSSLHALNYLARRVADAAIVMVATLRPEDEADSAGHLRHLQGDLQRHSHVHQLELAPLSEEETRILVRSCFRREGFTPHLFDVLYRRSAGVPLFAVESLDFLIARGVIYLDHGLWVNRRLEEADLPDSVRAAIRSRIEGLEEEQRELLSVAAVQGDHFDGGTVAKAISQPLTRTLKDLADLARRTRLVRADGQGFRFSHPVLSEVFYQMLPARRRRHLHLRLGYVTEQQRPGDVEALSHHMYEAGLYDRALTYLLTAAERARKANAYREARLLLTRGRSACEALNGGAPRESVLQVLLKLAEVEERLGDPSSSLALCEQVLQQADPRTDRGAVAEAYNQMGWIHSRQASWADAERYLQEAAKIYAELGDEEGVAVANVRMGNVAFERGELEAASVRFGDAKAAATQSGNLALLGAINGNLGVVSTVRGEYVDAIVHYTEAVKAYARIRDQYGVSQTYHNLGMCHAAQQDWPRALSCYEKGEELASKLGVMDVLANILVSRAAAQIHAGQLEAAEDACMKAQVLMEQLEDQVGLAECLKVEAMTLGERGEYGRAEETLRTAMASFSAVDNQLGVAECEVELGKVKREQGDVETARQRFEESVRMFQQLGAGEDARRAESLLAETGA